MSKNRKEKDEQRDQMFGQTPGQKSSRTKRTNNTLSLD